MQSGTTTPLLSALPFRSLPSTPGLHVETVPTPLREAAFSYSWGGRNVRIATSFGPLTRSTIGWGSSLAASCWVSFRAHRWVVGAALASLVLYRVVGPTHNYLRQEARKLTSDYKILGGVVALTTTYFTPIPAALYLGSSSVVHLLHRIQQIPTKQIANRQSAVAESEQPLYSAAGLTHAQAFVENAASSWKLKEGESSEEKKEKEIKKFLCSPGYISAISTHPDEVMLSWTWGGTEYRLTTAMNQAARTLTSIALHILTIVWFAKQFRNLLVSSLVLGFLMHRTIRRVQQSLDERLENRFPRLQIVINLAAAAFTFFSPRAAAVYYGTKIGSWMNPLWEQIKQSQTV